MNENFINALCNSGMEYVYLASLISSDKILTKEDAIKSLEYIDKTVDAVNKSSVSDEKKKQLMEYLEKSKSILKNDIEKFDK